MLELIRVAYQNWKVRKTSKAYGVLSKALQDDHDYWITWQANIAMTIHDNSKHLLPLEECNQLANSLMAHLFLAPKK